MKHVNTARHGDGTLCVNGKIVLYVSQRPTLNLYFSISVICRLRKTHQKRNLYHVEKGNWRHVTFKAIWIR